MRYDANIIQSLFPSILLKTRSNGIHLTFDDGPHPEATAKVLTILRKRNIFATFFLLGQSVQQYPEIAQQIIAEGHSCANHSYSHANLLLKNSHFIKREILQTEEILEQKLNMQSKFFRPPYGMFNFGLLKVLQEYRLTCVLWSHDSKDYRINTTKKIEKRIVNKLTDGSILLFHDNDYTVTKIEKYLPPILDLLLEKGFVFNKLTL
jgi:peptidoglycan/xylan/chitin deacetylase (PgdA/CDA1 family)